MECNEAVSKGEGDKESVVRTSVDEIELMIAVNALHVFQQPSLFRSSSCHREDMLFAPRKFNVLNSGEWSTNLFANKICK